MINKKSQPTHMRISWLFFHLLTFLIDAPFLKPVGGIVLLYTQSNPLPSPAEGQGEGPPPLYFVNPWNLPLARRMWRRALANSSDSCKRLR